MNSSEVEGGKFCLAQWGCLVNMWRTWQRAVAHCEQVGLLR